MNVTSDNPLRAVFTRRTLSICGVAGGTLFIVCLSIMVGTVPVTALDLLALLRPPQNASFADTVLRNIRLPRIVTGLLVGANLALAGTLLQGVLRNPLASPRVIGVNAGAGLAAVAVMVAAPGALFLIPPAAFIGALASALVVLALSHRSSGDPTTGIILAGVAISALLSSLTSGLMIINSDDLDVTYSWLIGGLGGRGWGHVRQIAPYSLVGTLGALYMAPKLDLFALGDEAARGLGLAVGLYRPAALMVAALLAGSAVSVGGTIGFVGLIAPHAARLLVGNEYRYVVVLAMFAGAMLLSGADLIARTLFHPVELPVGVVTAALGAPFFLMMLLRRRPAREGSR